MAHGGETKRIVSVAGGPWRQRPDRQTFLKGAGLAAAADRDPGSPSQVTAADLVIQRGTSARIGLGRPVQRMPQGTDRISRDHCPGPIPSRRNKS